MPDVDVAVVGGGISGLVSAYYLKQRGLNVAVIEAAERVGGVIRTVKNGPYVAEGGPQSYVADATFTRLAGELGIAVQMRNANDAATTRYFYTSAGLCAAPTSFGAFVKSPLLSTSGKFSVLREMFARPQNGTNESVAAFVRRRAGQEVLDRVAGPVISGIFAGDPSRLELKSAFPALAALERDHGSIVRGMMTKMRAARETGARPAPVTFVGGNQVLPDALATHLGDAVRTSSAVAKISIFHGGVEVRCGWGGLAVTASRALIATPAPTAADLLNDADPALAADLRSIEYAPVVQIALAYPRDAVGVPLDGFGFLATPDSGLRILGAVWNSEMFDGRAPADHVLVTAFIGGATNRELFERSDAALATMAHEDLERAMRISSVARQVVAGFRWDDAIPQYTIGHAERLRRIDTALTRSPRLALAGNYLRGISVADCIRQAKRTGETLSV